MEHKLSPEDYPHALREIPHPPAALWVRGDLPSVRMKTLAVVGSRAVSPYGERVCKELVGGLSGHPISIISGLALGTDAIAHKTALSAGLHTVAVLASGVADAAISPRTNLPIAQEILRAGGALVSENAPDYTPYPGDFPKRNRIIVGLSQAVLVIEAGERSGTLITARLAGEYNRDLLCVPHRADDPGGYGASLFIGLGATMVSSSAQILEALGCASGASADEYLLSKEEEAVLTLLLNNPLTKEQVLAQSPLSESDTCVALVTLELKEKVALRYGLWHTVY